MDIAILFLLALVCIYIDRRAEQRERGRYYKGEL